ncbi:translocation/assembly module TamB domain-containing protein [uncultured Kriegella sp.]|uniref:translocation/assembly module TamB domain-containing protein n=1 Tax=uncultured Kriegella sp. TaxID=1798910 RepID=UPI0030D95FB6|tara:strand:- start:24462 stop:29510 length:5049 start_codon:yes stop_codon:yes gene_type:complete
MEKKQKKYRNLRRTARVLLAILLFFVGLILFIRSPWGQDIIVSKVTGYVSEKTNTKVEIAHLFITFSGAVSLEGLYLEDKKGDTLIFSRSLEADLPIIPIIFQNEIRLKSLDWNGVTANITRKESEETFNFNFLLDALVPQDTTTVPSESAPMAISLGSLNFSDFIIKYDDDYLGIDSALKLGELNLDADEVDLENMVFALDNLAISDSNIMYRQTKPFKTETDTSEAALPYLSIANLELKNVKANYESLPDKTFADAGIGHFLLQIPKVDLESNIFAIDRLALENSNFSVRTDEQKTLPLDSTNTAKSATQPFEWPEYQVTANKISLQNNSVNYQAGNNTPTKGQFNPEAISISDFVMEADKLSYQPKEIHLELNELHFTERSGFQLKHVAFEANLEDSQSSLSHLEVETNNSSLFGSLNLKYTSFENLLKSPEETTVTLNIPNLSLAVQDSYVFQPDFANNEYLKKASQKPFDGHIKANGTLSAIQIPELNMAWGEGTSIQGQGTLGNVTIIDSLFFDLNTLKATSQRADLLQFISEEDLGIAVPKTVNVTASGKGNPSDFSAKALLRIPEGTAQLSGNFSTKEQTEFDGTLNVDSLQLNKLLKNEQLGAVSFTMDISGNGNSRNTLNARMKSKFTQLEFNSYDFSELSLEGAIKKGKGNIDLRFKDKNLNLEADTYIDLDSLNSKIKLSLTVIGADLYALGITENNIKVGGIVNADFTGNTDEYNLNARIYEGIAVMDNEQYRIGAIDLSTKIDKDSTNLIVDSNFLKGTLQSNAAPPQISTALQNQFRSYFSQIDSTTRSKKADAVRLKMKLSIQPIPVLTEVFFNGVEQLDSIAVQADFDASSKKLNADLVLPSAKYNSSSIDSLSIRITGDSTDLNFSAGFKALVTAPINIKKTTLAGQLKNRKLLLDFNSYDYDEKLMHIAAEMNLAKDTVSFHINPSQLVFNKKEWTVPQDNSIKIGENFLTLENMSLSRNAQKLTLSNRVSGIRKEHVGIIFNDFKLQTFMSFLNPDEKLLSGLVQGNLVIENPFEAPGIVADFKINELAVLENPLGNLTLNAVSKGLSAYDFDLAVKEGALDLNLTGDYRAAETGAELDLDLNLNALELKTIEGFSKDAIKDSNGYISGNIKVSGTTTAPQYEGNLAFNETGFKVTALNAIFRVSDETLRIDNAGLYLDNFSIRDANESTFTIDGTISTEELTNPEFGLSLQTEQFQLLDSTKEDNELFYGKASIDADITVKGSLNLPKIDGRLKVRKVTEVTYVVPESQLDVEERDGVVVFVNRENPDAILTRNDQEETPAFFRGIDVSTILEIADDAVFHIIIDERTGDNLQVSGDAALNLNVAPNGNISLTGRYELNSGHYETSLYNLVKRKFEINPGSTITWMGDPTDAKLDVTAIYKVETSASPLMASVTSSEDLSVTGKYRQVLPFLVYLNVDGELLEPKLSFNLDMPEDDQGSLGGAVYGRVQQLNEQESELNKQVFSLLALNRFFPDSGSDGSSGGTAALARDNVNKVLSGELNAFSDKVFGKTGFEVDFDLDSFTDYQGDSPQDRTQLNINAKKKLFNDRLIVTAGSAVDVEGSAAAGQEETPIIGNVSLEYLLTQDGRYRLKGFRKNEYQNIIDGQLIVTGIALIFNREFNAFSQLFNPLKSNSLEKKDAKKEAKPEAKSSGKNETKIEEEN